MKRIPIDYINMKWYRQERPVVDVRLNCITGFNVLNITFKNKYFGMDEVDKRLAEKELKRLKTKLKRFSVEHGAVHMDTVMEKVLGKEGLELKARKQELLTNVGDIFSRLKGKLSGRRKEILLVIGDNCFTANELKYLLLKAKNVYEDITVFSKDALLFDQRVFSYLEDEWGVVVNRLSEHAHLKSRYESVLFVISDWEAIAKCGFVMENAYVLCGKSLDEAVEKGLRMQADMTNAWTHLYVGYRYFIQEEEVPYQMAVDCLCQQQNEKIEASSVAIYEVK